MWWSFYAHTAILHYDSRIIGPPDLVVEVASPSTARHDRQRKRDLYARAGISEYWLVDPVRQTLGILVLEGAAYRSTALLAGPTLIQSTVIPTLADVRVEQFFL